MVGSEIRLAHRQVVSEVLIVIASSRSKSLDPILVEVFSWLAPPPIRSIVFGWLAFCQIVFDVR